MRFDLICEQRAREIVRTEVVLDQLKEYLPLFEQYRRPDKNGMFINLDFAQLYYLACIEREISPVLMRMCLGVENALRLWLVNAVEDYGNAETFMRTFYENEKFYIDRTYTPGNIDVLSDFHGDCFFLEQSIWAILKSVQFGTLLKMTVLFCQEHTGNSCELSIQPFLKQLDSVRRIRNIVAHNNSVVAQLPIAIETPDFALRARLGKLGIKNRSLKTNMKRRIVEEICGLFWVYSSIAPNSPLVLKEFTFLKDEINRKYWGAFSKNHMLVSVYNFLWEVINAFLKEEK